VADKLDGKFNLPETQEPLTKIIKKPKRTVLVTKKCANFQFFQNLPFFQTAC